MFCSNCGEKSEVGMSFCSSCGALLHAGQPPQQHFIDEPTVSHPNLQPPVYQSAVPQYQAKTKAPKSKMKALLIAGSVLIAICIALVALVMLGSSMTDPENTVRSYFDARMKGDWDPGRFRVY
jgi:uncharacterized membrane protein YvbJ